ncbi:hypothetical protein DSTSK_33710 [Desulforhabdus sp. TSK]|nr:hypothetical protein DSTSK_33710 [Desulforhabdus sp. TSK]
MLLKIPATGVLNNKNGECQALFSFLPRGAGAFHGRVLCPSSGGLFY